ncbi:nitrilase, arylacetone-specific [Roseibium sp. TrichSKD4]|uniref:carbon-nitrogen hydrolase family protein n=1 Tax=Roseibium sp. TrichSKD4 TaxID=744980 RepID=UPI0001E562A3|nr:carbon-nitrogen hydrolase family protein [Roseibium sp. TrichSKD4]EFO33823.1 nitrilase, arylacetone-specific [Roseibium sp. TrichSKD4]
MVKVAAVQAAPVWMDAKGTLEKTLTIIEDAAGKGVQLVAFGEVWLPGYPFTIWLQAPMVAMDVVMKHRVNAITLDGPEMAAICEAARTNRMWVMMGFAERDRGSIYCSQALVDDRGEIVLSRRKLRPTHMERTVWGEGPATDIKVVDTPFGKVGGLCCWENIQPVNRQGMYQLGEEIHVACWPSFGMFKGMRQAYALSAEANMAESQSYAMQGGCFVIAPNSVISEESLEAITMGNPDLRNIVFAGGGSAAVFGPDGYRLTDPIPDTEEGLAIAEIDLAMIEGAKVFADPAGHYFRPDVTRLVLEAFAGPAEERSVDQLEEAL